MLITFKAMFYIGSNCLDWPNECRRGVNDGHHISVRMLSPPTIRRPVCVTHPMFVLLDTWSHRYMTALPNENAFAELWYTVSNGYPSQCRFIIFNGPIIRGRQSNSSLVTLPSSGVHHSVIPTTVSGISPLTSICHLLDGPSTPKTGKWPVVRSLRWMSTTTTSHLFSRL